MAWVNVEELIEDDVHQCGGMVGYNYMVVYMHRWNIRYTSYMLIFIKLYKATKPHP
jgi:hypothetical protein